MTTELPTTCGAAVRSSDLLAELEAVRRREEWGRTRAQSPNGYMIASAKAEMVNEIIAMVRRHSANASDQRPGPQ